MELLAYIASSVISAIDVMSEKFKTPYPEFEYINNIYSATVEENNIGYAYDEPVEYDDEKFSSIYTPDSYIRDFSSDNKQLDALEQTLFLKTMSSKNASDIPDALKTGVGQYKVSVNIPDYIPKLPAQFKIPNNRYPAYINNIRADMRSDWIDSLEMVLLNFFQFMLFNKGGTTLFDIFQQHGAQSIVYGGSALTFTLDPKYTTPSPDIDIFLKFSGKNVLYNSETYKQFNRAVSSGLNMIKDLLYFFDTKFNVKFITFRLMISPGMKNIGKVCAVYRDYGDGGHIKYIPVIDISAWSSQVELFKKYKTDDPDVMGFYKLKNVYIRSPYIEYDTYNTIIKNKPNDPKRSKRINRVKLYESAMREEEQGNIGYSCGYRRQLIKQPKNYKKPIQVYPAGENNDCLPTYGPFPRGKRDDRVGVNFNTQYSGTIRSHYRYFDTIRNMAVGKAIIDYTGSWSSRVNNYLQIDGRAKSIIQPDEISNIKTIIRNIDQAFESCPETSENMVLYAAKRMTVSSELKTNNNLSAGDVISCKTFLSTTVDPRISPESFFNIFDFCCMYIIRVPVNSTGVMLLLKNSHYPNENECLISRHSKLKITHVNTKYARFKDGTLIPKITYIMDLIPPYIQSNPSTFSMKQYSFNNRSATIDSRRISVKTLTTISQKTSSLLKEYKYKQEDINYIEGDSKGVLVTLADVARNKINGQLSKLKAVISNTNEIINKYKQQEAELNDIISKSTVYDTDKLAEIKMKAIQKASSEEYEFGVKHARESENQRDELQRQYLQAPIDNRLSLQPAFAEARTLYDSLVGLTTTRMHIMLEVEGLNTILQEITRQHKQYLNSLITSTAYTQGVALGKSTVL